MQKTFTIRIRKSPKGGGVLVIIVPVKMFPKAVDRNRARRRLKEAFRRMVKVRIPGMQYVITVHHPDVLSQKELEQALFELCTESGIVVR
jgi:ribonuclease P protein component